MARTAANRAGTGGAKRPQARANPDNLGKRHRRKATPKTATAVQCWTRARKDGGIYRHCAKAEAAKKKKRTKAGQGGGKKPLIKTSDLLVPNLSAPLYPGQTVQQGATSQYAARHGTLRRAGAGGRQPQFVNLPPRERRKPQRYGQKG